MRFLTACVLVLSACSPRAIPGTQAAMTFDRGRDVWKAPVPSDDLIMDDGHVDMRGFQNPTNNSFLGGMIAILAADARGFSTAAPIMFRFTASLAPDRLPALEVSATKQSPITLVSIDPRAPDFLTRYPFRAEFMRDGGPFGASNMLAILPLQGRPLRPNTRYAAIVQRKLGDKDGALLGVPLAMSQLLFGERPNGMHARAHEAYMQALRVVDRDLGIPASAIAAITVFTTDDVTGGLARGRERILQEPLPVPEAAFSLYATHPGYCVMQTTVQLPVMQVGQPPFFSGGGNWVVDDDGAPIVQGHERANLMVTVPRTPMPPAGFPAIVYMRQGGNGVVPLADRGVHPMNHADAVPGSGPAQEFAKVGYAGVSLDGPHGGLRNYTGTDEQLTLFNFFNPIAMRDNMRESAIEIDLLAAILPTLTIDASACAAGPLGAPGAAVKLDTKELVLFGHSTGAWITPIAAAFEPRFKNVIMSGAGASWVENILFKRMPVDVKVVAKGILEYGSIDRELTEFDPAVMLAQWAADPSDPQNYAPHIVDRPPEESRNVLVFQGIVDSYIMPPIANALNLSAGLDLGGAGLDAASPALADLPPYGALSPLIGRGAVELPASLNRNGTRPVTAIVVQHEKDAIEDGHEAMFQREEPKYQYRCFLRTLKDDGAPRVPVGINSPDVCP
ncbi:MAG: hypothetical protein IT381_07635 [Deltaproteobacteria bacterium]|nr:hypothetical protein [Deltaproteobacteria bacterium]